jgi:hypothetical protein
MVLTLWSVCGGNGFDARVYVVVMVLTLWSVCGGNGFDARVCMWW